MIEVGLGLLAILPQTEDRIDFSLEPGAILVAIGFFVLVNLLLAAALYPFFKDGSLLGDTSAEKTDSREEVAGGEDMIEGASAADNNEPLEERVEEFLEDIHGEKNT
jgi:hypothetical protein